MSEERGAFGRVLKHFADNWRWLAALVVLAAFGAAYLDKKLFSRASAPPAAVAQQLQPPASPSTPQTQAGGALAPPPAPLDLNNPEAGAAPEWPAADQIASQATDIAARPVALLRGQGAWADGVKTLSEAIDRVSAALAKAGLAATGRPLAVFTETNDVGFHFEAMVPIDKAPEGKGKLENGVEIGASPAGKALKFQHRGPYDDIDTTYEAITAFLDEKGLDTRNLFVEEYLTDLKTSDDEGLEVDIYVFLK
jgi:effector-binding domain-containing protein